MSGSLQIRRNGRVLHLILNRPEKRNALDFELCRELTAALEKAEHDRAVGCVLLSGAGRGFCAGMDLSEILAAPAGLNEIHEQLFSAGVRMTKPLVGAIHGSALAGGTGLAANCHVALCSEDARFGLTEIRIGLWPFLIFRSMLLAVGERRAVELALTGRTFGAAEAREYGLVHQVVPAQELEKCAAETAARLAESSPVAIEAGLAYVHQIRGKSWEEAGRLGRQVRDEVFQGPDFQEGVRAFQEKRQPRWPSLD